MYHQVRFLTVSLVTTALSDLQRDSVFCVSDVTTRDETSGAFKVSSVLPSPRRLLIGGTILVRRTIEHLSDQGDGGRRMCLQALWICTILFVFSRHTYTNTHADRVLNKRVHQCLSTDKPRAFRPFLTISQ